MPSTRAYLQRNFSALFFSFFLPIIAIASLILFVRIAKMTEIVQINAFEMFTLFGYALPLVLFFTLPITFFSALLLTMTRLAADSELIILFSFGISPHRLSRFFFSVATLATLVLLIFSLGLVPLSKQMTKSFINVKRSEAVINIEASKFGQKFGDWMVFVESKDPKSEVMKNIILFSPQKGEEQFLNASEGRFIHDDNQSLGLQLHDGSGYYIREGEIDELHFNVMQIFDTSAFKPFIYESIIAYWLQAFSDNKRMHDLLLSIMVSLFPLATVYLAMAFGIVHARYQKSHGYLAILLVTASYYAIASWVSYQGSFLAAFSMTALTALLGYLLFYFRTQKHF